MMNKSYGFRKKGGLFTEFSNKNIGSINVNKNDIRERLKKEKENGLYQKKILLNWKKLGLI